MSTPIPRRGLAIALALLLAGCATPETTQAGGAGGGETIKYRLSLDTQVGPIQVDGTTAYANGGFTILTTTFGGWIQMYGKLVGKAMKVTGDYRGNYMRGEATAADNLFVIGLDVTGDLNSAVLTLSVPPSVAAKLAAPQ